MCFLCPGRIKFYRILQVFVYVYLRCIQNLANGKLKLFSSYSLGEAQHFPYQILNLHKIEIFHATAYDIIYNGQRKLSFLHRGQIKGGCCIIGIDRQTMMLYKVMERQIWGCQVYVTTEGGRYTILQLGQSIRETPAVP